MYEVLLFLIRYDMITYRVGQKVGPQTHDHNSVKSCLVDLKKNSLEDFLSEFAVKWLLKVPPCICCYTTL